MNSSTAEYDDIAIISVGGRFPGVKSIDELWDMIREGKEKIEVFTDEELRKSKVPEYLLRDPNYVKASAVINDIDMFDAKFFKFNRREAEFLNPQHRIFLECCWEILERAGYNIDNYTGRIGVYAGEGFNSYFMDIASNSELLQKVNEMQVLISNDKDFLSTQVSYKLNLTGPSMTVQSGCSTSLLATTLACQGLKDYQCDMAIAGGIRLGVPQKTGYLYKEGGILSKDGHCRPFDKFANGTVGGNGAALVLLKRLEDAIEDGDYIYAVIKGTAVNNDGSLKVGYTAPSVDKQAEAIYEALEVSGVDVENIDYIETHGTGTALGDPIEFTALDKVFSSKTNKKNYCALGSMKANIGHLDSAAGVAGLIKAALAINKKIIPPLANFSEVNPKIKIKDSSFYIPNKPIEWHKKDGHRAAGVSSFGIGGTNVHVVLEEAPSFKSSETKSKIHILPMSSISEEAIEDMRKNLINHFRKNMNENIADAAYTLQNGRKNFDCREAVICKSISDGIDKMENLDSDFFVKGKVDECRHNIIFMFPGQGSQYINMGRKLFEEEKTFRDNFNLCCKLFEKSLGIELKEIIYPINNCSNSSDINETYIAQAALFTIEYSLAKTLVKYGIVPNCMIGHSLGEYVAACLAGVFSLEDAIELISVRGRMMQSQKRGAMIAAFINVETAKNVIDDEISIAAVNSPSSCVLSGDEEAIKALEEKFKENDIGFRRLNTSHAFHSKMMEPMIEGYRERLKRINIKSNNIPMLSNLTGTCFKDDEIKNAETWCKHIVSTVRFSDEIQEVINDKPSLFIEVGPGNSLSTLVKRCMGSDKKSNAIINAMRHIRQDKDDFEVFLNCIVKAWTKGVDVKWNEFYKSERRSRIPLPTYPFERKQFWIEKSSSAVINGFDSMKFAKETDISKWMYTKYWKPKAISISTNNKKSNFMIFCDELGLGKKIADNLKSMGNDVIRVYFGNKYCHIDEDTIEIDSCNIKDYEILFKEVQKNHKTPHNIIHVWSVDNEADKCFRNRFNNIQQKGCYSLVNIIQALGMAQISDGIRITVVSSDVEAVFSTDNIYPEKATILSPILTIPQEHSNISVVYVDLSSNEFSRPGYIGYITKNIINEVFYTESDHIIAYRNNLRLIPQFDNMQLCEVNNNILLQNGIYIIIGGLGNIGLEIAKYISNICSANIILIGRSKFPDREDWNEWINKNGQDNFISRKISQIVNIEKKGSKIRIFSADVSNKEQMEKIIKLTLNEFNNINGIINAAGVIGKKTYKSIEELDEKFMQNQFKAKVYGTYVIKELIKDIKLDFCLLISSLSTVLGGLGLTAYAAANMFLDAAAEKYSGSNNWKHIDLDGWNFSGKVENNEGLYISPEEGTKVLDVIFSSGVLNNIVVSVGQLNCRIQKWVVESNKIITLNNKLNRNVKKIKDASFNDIEEKLAYIWIDLLGVEDISLNDNFFDLGGNSLLATQVIYRMRVELKVDFSIEEFFKTATIKEIASKIAKNIEDEKKVFATLNKVKALSQEEVTKLLKEVKKGGSE